MFFHDRKMRTELFIEKRIDRDVEHELHMHDLLEINILLDNQATFKLLNKEYLGESGDVFIFRPYEPHYNLVKDSTKPITWLMVLFSPSIARLIPYGYRLLYPFYTQSVTPHLFRTSIYAQNVHAAAISAYEEQENKLPGWESKQFMYFIDILLNIYRFTLEQSEDGGAADVETGVIATVEHILKNITDDINIPHLIKLHGKGKTNFYSSFKEVTSLTPNHFIHRMRMQIAMHLLNTTNKTITEIAFECGYSSIHYFNKIFKQYRGASPREHRNDKKKLRII